MEIDQGLLTKVKTYLRISHTKLDDDVADSISACRRICGFAACEIHRRTRRM